MPDLLGSKVLRATRMDDRWREHAAHQAMTAVLSDWEQAEATLRKRIQTLRDLRDRRVAEVAAGTWPPRRAVEGPESRVAPGRLADEERSAPSTVSDPSTTHDDPTAERLPGTR